MHRATRSTAFVIGIAIAVSGCTADPPGRAGGPELRVDLSAAVHRLAGMDPLAAADQRRDWTRTALAAHLGLDTAALRDQTYDALPVRDDGFADLARQPVGPGRALFAGDTLHLLVPDDNPRTAGLLLDQHRADAGADAPAVRVHRYTERGTGVDVDSAEPVPTAELRARLGYVEARVDGGQGLADFLGKATALSTLEVRGAEVWAGGWTWPGAKLSPQDVAVLHRAYTSDDRPGFSLDPSEPTVESLLAAIPDLDRELAARIIGGDWAGSEFGSVESFTGDVESAVFDGETPARLTRYGISDDRSELWALLRAADGGSFASHARYDGGLEGTEVGMTLFYTDYIAKDWVSGVGDGVPSDAVPGFVPKPDAPTAWSHCAEAEEESGRLWFGQNDAAFAFHDNRVDLGAQATRLFTRSDADGGAEVESSYAFGGALRWWDRHYQAVADYEPQYARLELLMRWSAALEWLVTTTEHRLALVSPDEVRDDLTYAEWYAGNDALRERGPIKLVDGADPEQLLPLVSETYENCGGTWVEGGVSLGDVLARKGDRAFRADLPPSANRAGLVDETSRVDADGSGVVKNPVLDDRGEIVDVVSRKISAGEGGAAEVATTGGGRAVAPLGSLKVWLDKAVKRTTGTTLRAGDGRVEHSMTFQGHDLGTLTAVKDGSTVSVSWRSGLLDRARTALSDAQARLVADPGSRPVPRAGVLYSHSTGGKTLHRVGDGDEPWLAITAGTGKPGDTMVLRLGAPDTAGAPEFFHGQFTAGPGPPSGWLTVTDGAAAFGPDSPPGRAITVTTGDGRTGVVHESGPGWATPVDDPVLGLRAPAEGAALLRDMSRIAPLLGGETVRAVALSTDAVALVGPDGIRLVGPLDPWASRVRTAIAGDPAGTPEIRVAGDRAFHVAAGTLIDPGEPRTVPLPEALTTDLPVYLHDQFRAHLGIGEGPILAEALAPDLTVTVREASTDYPLPSPQVVHPHTQPDARADFGATWWRVDGRIATGQSTQVTTTTAAPTTTASAAPEPVRQRVLLICPEDAEDLVGCA